jgi:glutamine synthetase
MRFPDSTANPYLAFAALMMAGIDGIKNKLEPVGPMDEDLFELSLDEIRDKKIPQMPATLREALEGLISNNDFLKPVFTDDMIDTYQHYQFQRQVWPDEARPTAYEFKSTYSC